MRRQRTTILRHRPLRALLGGLLLVVASCASSDDPTGTMAPVEGCADVVHAEVERSGDAFIVSATVRSADTGWDRYADEWRVRTPDGEVLGTRVLAHPHVDEQPFTRSLSGVEIPESVASVVVVARDSVVGYCGISATVSVP